MKFQKMTLTVQQASQKILINMGVQLNAASSTCVDYKKVHVVQNLQGLDHRVDLSQFIIASLRKIHPFFIETYCYLLQISWLDLPPVHSLITHVLTMVFRVKVW